MDTVKEGVDVRAAVGIAPQGELDPGGFASLCGTKCSERPKTLPLQADGWRWLATKGPTRHLPNLKEE
eukprot:9334662-Pyramimonas_sp.AAC.1